MTGTFWAILPPVIAIVLALITKEVYLSLMIGIASGALMYHNFHLIKAMDTIFAIMGEKIGANCDILIFLVLLGILVALITNQVLPEPMENGQQKQSGQRDMHFLQRSLLEL